MARLGWLLNRPVFTAAVYAIISWIWISASDTLLLQANLSHQAEELISIVKGSIFVAGTALLIYFLLRVANSEIAHANRAEDARTESEQRFRVLADSTPVLVWMSDTHGTCDYFNKEWLTFTGRSLDQETGIGWTEGVHNEDVQRYLDAYGAAFSDRSALKTEYRLRRHDGQYRWVLNNGVPRYTLTGGFAGYIGSCVDISDQKEAAATLSSANAMLLGVTQTTTTRLAAIVESSDDAIIGYDLDGIITDWNQAATRMYDYSSEEVIGRKFSIIMPSSRVNEFTEILNTVASGQRIQQLETVRQRRDGTLLDVSFSVSPITGQDETIIGGSAIVHDITNRKRMEEELRRSEERFRLVSLATKDAIWDLDIRSGKAWRSEGFWERFGYSPRDTEPNMAGWKDLLHPEDRDRVSNGFQTALLRLADSFEAEYRFRRADDSYAVVLDRTYIVYDETGQPTRAIGAMTDLSEHRELEEQFRQAQKMEAVGRLAGGIAHDFNNILMVITTYAEMAREQPLPKDKLLKYLAEVLKAAGRAAALTHQLLAFSRKQVLSPRIIDINVVIEESLKMIERLIGEDIDLDVSLGGTLWAVKADPGQIVQVLMNLCVNARDAMRDGGELRIETKNLSVDVETARRYPALVPGDYTVLVVSDTGTGMTKEVQAHLFDPFFTTKESGKGTGLGLSTVYGIVKQSGGYVWVDSELGRGSSFSLYFPAVDAPLTTISTPVLSVTEGRGETILLAEDDSALREAISAHLKVHGYTVIEAADGAEGLRLAKLHAGSIQGLITDVILPKLSGAELGREISEMSPQVVTLYMSGYTDRQLVDYDPASTTTGFLQKPFALRTLLEKLGEMIARRG